MDRHCRAFHGRGGVTATSTARMDMMKALKHVRQIAVAVASVYMSVLHVFVFIILTSLYLVEGLAWWDWALYLVE